MPDFDLAGLTAANAHFVAHDDGSDGVSVLERSHALFCLHVPH